MIIIDSFLTLSLRRIINLTKYQRDQVYTILNNLDRQYDHQFDIALEKGADLKAFDAEAVEQWLPRCPIHSRAYVISIIERYRAKLK